MKITDGSQGEGGTHNMMAPSVDLIQLSFVPTLRLMNIHVSTELKIYGFFPVGVVNGQR